MSLSTTCASPSTTPKAADRFFEAARATFEFLAQSPRVGKVFEPVFVELRAVRTWRDSKADAGLSFIALHDGTCFDTIQIVAKGNLPNYADQVAKLVTGASIECDGAIVTNPKGGNEIAATALRVLGWVEDPDK